MITKKYFRSLANKEIALGSQRFMKPNKGEYAYGDKFLGIRVPKIREIAKENISLSISKTNSFIRSEFHEERLLGLIILVYKYEKERDESIKEELYQNYLAHFKYINNWDLVDVTCPKIIGRHLFERDRSILYTWAKSDNLWIKRISMITNWWFIRKGDLREVYKLSVILLHDEHDLIHKAVGWMLREAWKKDSKQTEAFLKKYYKQMPRTMLRYAIEKIPEGKRQKYLKNKI